MPETAPKPETTTDMAGALERAIAALRRYADLAGDNPDGIASILATAEEYESDIEEIWGQ